MKITNKSKGPRGFYNGDALVMLERGETWEGELSDVDQKAAEGSTYFAFGEAGAREAAAKPEESPVDAACREVGEKAQAYINELRERHGGLVSSLTERAETAETEANDLLARVATLEAENADLLAKLEAGGKGDLPALTGKNKADLLKIAADESVEIEEGATNDDIRSAIELKREAAAA